MLDASSVVAGDRRRDVVGVSSANQQRLMWKEPTGSYVQKYYKRMVRNEGPIQGAEILQYRYRGAQKTIHKKYETAEAQCKAQAPSN